MKRLIALSVLGLLLSGCKSDKEHIIVCVDAKTKQLSYYVPTSTNVGAFVVYGHSVLAFKNKDGKEQIIFLSENDCMIY